MYFSALNALYVWIDDNRTVVDMEADGNCLFRALSDQLYWDFGNMHADIRSDISDYLEAFEADFSSFLVLEDEDEDAADFESYVHTMRQDGEWGGNLELVAAARLYW
jgi:OTU domain-containing protein 3